MHHKLIQAYNIFSQIVEKGMITSGGSITVWLHLLEARDKGSK